MAPANAPLNTTAVNDFRRHRMALQWHKLDGTWTACDTPPQFVHGVALIRPEQPNICVFGQGGRLHLQIGVNQYALSDMSPRIKCTRGAISFGLRRRFVVESSSGGVLWSHSYWASQGNDFFLWLAARAEDPDWRAANGRRWSEGIDPVALRTC